MNLNCEEGCLLIFQDPAFGVDPSVTKMEGKGLGCCLHLSRNRGRARVAWGNDERVATVMTMMIGVTRTLPRRAQTPPINDAMMN